MASASPYEILGISPSATDEAVRARYLLLARQHHPDKLANQSVEVIKEHEAKFKRIGEAYRTILEWRKLGGGPGLGDGASASLNDWLQMFNKVKHHFKDIIQAAAEARREARANAPREACHKVHLPVTLEEVQHERRRKVMLTLKGYAEPVHVDVACRDFPLWKCSAAPGRHGAIEVHMTFAPHALYETDESYDGVTWDLFYDVPVTLLDYFKGGTFTVPRLDGSPYEDRAFAPFFGGTGQKDPSSRHLATIRDDALWRLGNVYVSYQLVLPSAAAWEGLGGGLKGPEGGPAPPAADQPTFLAILERLHPKST